MEIEAGQIAEAIDEAVEEVTPGQAMRVAEALKAKGGDEFSKPGSIIEIKFVKGVSLSLTGSRLLALMILTAGGDAWEDRPHHIRKADIRRGHKGNERITHMLQELHQTLFAVDDKSWRGGKATLLFSLISRSREETEEEGGEAGWLEWGFTPDARDRCATASCCSRKMKQFDHRYCIGRASSMSRGSGVVNPGTPRSPQPR